MKKRLAVAILVAAVAMAGALFASPSHGAANQSTQAYCRNVAGACRVAVTATGPSPSSVKLPAAGVGVLAPYKYVEFHNTDSATHTVVFANGLCSLTLAPGDYGVVPSFDGPCADNFLVYVGTYSYTVDEKFAGSVVLAPVPRSVTLTARTHTIRRGTRLTLRGLVHPAGGRYHVSDPPGWKHVVTVTVLARHNSDEPYQAIATVNPRLLTTHPGGWKLIVRPDGTTTYLATVTSQPPQGQIWTNAKSRPFTVRIRQEGRG